MKLSKKIISVILALTMIMTTMSVGFSVFALVDNAAGVDDGIEGGIDEVTKDELKALADALLNKNVANATFNVSNKTTTVTDTTGDIMKMAKAYWVVFYKAVAWDRDGTGADQADSKNRLPHQINTKIKNAISAEVGETKYNEYKCASVLDAMIANMTGNGAISESTNIGNAKEYNFSFTINLDKDFVLNAASVDDIPDFPNRSYSFSYKIARGSYPYLKYFERFFYTLKEKKETAGNPLDVSKLKALNETVKTYVDTLGLTSRQLLDAFETTKVNDELYLNIAYQALKTAYDEAKAAGFTDPELAKWFNVSQLNDSVSALESASIIATYKPIVSKMQDLLDDDYSDYSFEELEEYYFYLNESYEAYMTLDAADRAVIESELNFDPTPVPAILEEVEDAYINGQLLDLKVKIPAAVEKYNAYTEEYVAANVSGTELGLEIAELNGYVNVMTNLISKNSEKVSAFYPEYAAKDKADLAATITFLKSFEAFANVNDGFMAKYEEFVTDIYTQLELDVYDDGYTWALDVNDEWYTDFKAFCDEIVKTVGAERAEFIFRDVKADALAKMDSRYRILEEKVDAQTKLAVEIWEGVKALYGDEVDIVSVSSFAKYAKAFRLVDTYGIEVLDKSPNWDLDQAIVERYELLKTYNLDKFNAFVENAGFDMYEQTEIDDIVREPNSNDIVRDKDYTVTDEKVEEIIELLNGFLYSDEAKELLNLNLKELITPDLLKALYSNDFINTLVNLLYPLVLHEFAKVWDGLPPSITVDDIKVKVIITFNVAVTANLYLEDVETATNKVGLYLTPATLADNITKNFNEDGFFDNTIEQLNKARDEVIYDSFYDKTTSGWTNSEIYSNEKLNIDWGVKKGDEESFIKAATAALSGLEPLLLALLSNVPMDCSGDKKVGIGTGRGNITDPVTLVLEVDEISLNLTATGNEGFNNVIIPILEALNVDTSRLPDGNTLTSTESVIREGIIPALKAVINQFSAASVQFVLDALPNLAYALEAQRIVPLLKNLKTNIFYQADAHYNAGNGLKVDNLEGIYPPKDDQKPIEINVGNMVNFDKLPVDIYSFNGILEFVGGLLGFELPKVDAAKLATLGELTWKESRRTEKAYNYGDEDQVAYIQANRADVLLFLVDYLLEAVETTDILGKLTNGAKLPEIVNTILANVLKNGDDAIAAIVEAVFPQEYSELAGMNWVEKVSDEDHEAAMEKFYDNDFNAEMSEFLGKNLDSFLDNLLVLFGVKVDDVVFDSLSGLVKNLINDKLYSAELIDTIAKALADVFGGLDDTLRNLVKKEIGIDTDAWTGYKASFETGDAAAFKAALIEVLAPLTPVLKFVLADEDISLFYSVDGYKGDNLVTLLGHDGYSTAIVPLLEALGAEGVLTTEAFYADTDNLVANIINPLFTVVDKVANDVYEAVNVLVPNILYFCNSGGLRVVIENILYPINQVLDTIRPIYDVNLYSMISFDIKGLENDPIGVALLIAAAEIEKSTGIKLKIDFTGTELANALAYGDIEEFISANGQTAYRVSPTEESKIGDLTVILTYLISQINFKDNATLIANLAKTAFGLDDEAYAFLYSILYANSASLDNAATTTLSVLTYIFFGVDTALDVAVIGYDFLSYDWEGLYNLLLDSDVEAVSKVAAVVEASYATFFKPLFDEYTAQRILDDLPGDVGDKVQEGLDDVNDKLGEVAGEIDGANKEVKGLFAKILAMFQQLIDQIKRFFTFKF